MPSRFQAPYSVDSSAVSADSWMRTVAPIAASCCWTPPLAIVVGPTEVPVGENGCFASATRTLPSGPVYRCAPADVTAGSAKATARTSDRMFESCVDASPNSACCARSPDGCRTWSSAHWMHWCDPVHTAIRLKVFALSALLIACGDRRSARSTKDTAAKSQALAAVGASMTSGALAGVAPAETSSGSTAATGKHGNLDSAIMLELATQPKSRTT